MRANLSTYSGRLLWVISKILGSRHCRSTKSLRAAVSASTRAASRGLTRAQDAGTLARGSAEAFNTTEGTTASRRLMYGFGVGRGGRPTWSSSVDEEAREGGSQVPRRIFQAVEVC